MATDYPPPGALAQPMLVRDKQLMGPGPSNVSPRVLNALSLPVMGHLHAETCQIMDEVKAGLQYAFQTRNALTLALSASGHGGMEAAICNLVERGDTVLIGINGLWGERAADMASRYGAKVQVVEQTPGQHFCPDAVDAALKKHRPVLFFVTHGDSSTGVCQPLDKLGAICHKYDTLFVVDTVASLGGVPVFTDRWGIDVIYTGSQKVIGAPPGMAPISFSARAVQKILSRTTPVAVFYFDVTILGNYWFCFGGPRVYHHTIPVSLLYGLREALALLADETLERSWARHAACAQRLYSGLARAGLELYVPRAEVRLPTVTTIVAPGGVDARAVQQYAMDKHLVEIAGGLGPTLGKVFRIGIMGVNATPEKVDKTLSVLVEAIEVARSNSAKL